MTLKKKNKPSGSLPSNPARLEEPKPVPVTLDPSKTALLIIDTQKDYCLPEGKHFVEDSVDKVPNIALLLGRARDLGLPVVYTQNWLGDPDGSWARSFNEGFTITPPHCIADTHGAEMVDEIKPEKGDFVIKKASYSMMLGIHGKDAEKTMTEFREENPEIETFIVMGCCCIPCVFFNSDVVNWLGYKLVVPLDGIVGSPVYQSDPGSPGWNYAMWFLKNVEGAQITTTRQIEFSG
jgi:nicotinamidase-related amidase